MSSDPATSNTLQSIRSSCDRCRLQKLKCTVPTESDGPVPCERCTRAKVPCVFGRRRRANRPRDMSLGLGRTGLDMLATPSPTSASTQAAPDLQLTEPTECESEATTAYGAQPWDSLTLGLHNASDNVLGQQGGMSGWEWLQHDFSLDNACIMDADTLDPSLRSPSPVFLAPSQPTDGIMLSGDTTPSNSTPGQRLAALIADMQQRLKMLEEWPRQHDSPRSLDDYPVGAVLHLFQEFTAVAGPVLSSARAAGTTIASLTPRELILEAAACGETQTTELDDAGLGAGASRGPGTDTATTLLVLCGYMWLVRIYSIVLGHFQMHLGRIPSSGNSTTGHGGVAGSASTKPTLQLSELPCASTAPYLGRIHTAVCMLLTALQGVEEQLGQGGGVARNLVVRRLTQESVLRAGEVQDGCGGLGRKVCSVKSLLREKMGL